jgi:hypothetical protein
MISQFSPLSSCIFQIKISKVSLHCNNKTKKLSVELLSLTSTIYGKNVGFIREVTHKPNALRFWVNMWCQNLLWSWSIDPWFLRASPDSPTVVSEPGSAWWESGRGSWYLINYSSCGELTLVTHKLNALKFWVNLLCQSLLWSWSIDP